MIVISEKTLKLFKGPGFCECGCGWYGPLDPNHILQRGPGGGSRLDIRANLLGLRHEPCHNAYHDGRPGYPSHKEQRERFCEIVAKREGFESGPAVWDWLNMILGLPKGSKIPAAPVCPW